MSIYAFLCSRVNRFEVYLWLFLDTFGRPVNGRREKRGDSATSDQGTGDEATLPRTEERPAKKKNIIRRSRSTTRSGQSSTPNVPTEVHKKQLFSGRKSGGHTGWGRVFFLECVWWMNCVIFH